jgi:acyl-CoA synthetase (NDP forming)
MINKQLINPASIVVVGGSNDISKPGGKILKNILDGHFKGRLYVSNLKEDEVQGIKSYHDIRELPDTDLAVIAIPAAMVPGVVDILAREKNTRAFIVLSAGFSEESEEGRQLEEQILASVNAVNGALLGPNCTGILTPNHHSIFTEPVPNLTLKGCSLVSGSGATACFIMEAGIPKGLTFSSVFSVGNSAQMGVEDVVKYMDKTYDPASSSDIKLLYMEKLDKPGMLLQHASSLIRKGCRIAAIKAGTSEAGIRAASSHTGALASSDMAVEALFRKAGIVRCHGREELIAVASVFMQKKMKGKNVAVISHAGGPAVMLTDTLVSNGLNVPPLEGAIAEELKRQLFPGSSVANPIDFLATGNAAQLKAIIDYVDKRFEDIDGMAVIFGTPGLKKIFDVYKILQEKIDTSTKPIYPVLPSGITAHEEMELFRSAGRVFFPDEVILGKALAQVCNTPPPASSAHLPDIDTARVRAIVEEARTGYIAQDKAVAMLDAAGIQRVTENIIHSRDQALKVARKTGYPVVMKVIGPVHKTDTGGVALNIINEKELMAQYERLINIPETTSLLLQPMLSGMELFAGVKYEDPFGHLLFCGLGGVLIELIRDVSVILAPAGKQEALAAIRRLKGYRLFQGYRDLRKADEETFADVICHLSALLKAAPEIDEMDINPLFTAAKGLYAVDARIHINK